MYHAPAGWTVMQNQCAARHLGGAANNERYDGDIPEGLHLKIDGNERRRKRRHHSSSRRMERGES